MAFEFSLERLVNAGLIAGGNKEQRAQGFANTESLNEEDRKKAEQASEFARMTKQRLLLQQLQLINDPNQTTQSREAAAMNVKKLSENLGVTLPELQKIGGITGGDIEKASKILDLKGQATDESFAKFTQSGNPADLVERDKEQDEFERKIGNAKSFVDLAAASSPESLSEFVNGGSKDPSVLKPREDVDDPNLGEFERLIDDLPPEEQAKRKDQRLDKLTQLTGGGFAASVDEDGNIILAQGGVDELTRAQRGKEIQEFRASKRATKTFLAEAEKIKAVATPEALGAVGGVARFADNVAAQTAGVLRAFNKTAPADLSPDRIVELAGKSAGMQTALFNLALQYAAAIGLGEGRALTDADITRALKAIGAKDASPNQLASRLDIVADKVATRVIIEGGDILPDEADALKDEFGGFQIQQPVTPEGEESTEDIVNRLKSRGNG